MTALSLQTAYQPNLAFDDPLYEYASLYLSLYDQKTTGPDHAEWVASLNDEWHRQLHRAKTLQLYSTDGSIPKNSRVANVSLAARLKYDQHNAIKEYRSRVTWGIEKGTTAHLDSSSTTMSITTFKTLLHSTISQPFKSLATIDIIDFYIQHDAEGTPAYLKTRNGKIPEATRISLGTNHLPHDAIIVFKTLKIIYGQTEAGKISQKHLENHLRSNGFIETSTTCLFKSTNPTNDIRIGEWSDDLIIQYDTRTTQLDDFSAMLKKRYPHRLHRITPAEPNLIYLGYNLTIHRNPLDHSQDKLIASMPHYLKNMFTKLKFEPTSKPKSPSVYVPITYSKEPQLEWTDDSPPASTADKDFLLTAVGSLRYFADGVCPPLTLATNKLSSQQSTPTLNTMTNLDRVLNYAYYNQDAALTFHSSNMKQIIHSDASYLSDSNSRSYAGGYHTFGPIDFTGPDNPHLVNAPVLIISTAIKPIVRSVMEAEYGAMFINASVALPIKEAAENLGHPQGPIEIIYDNEIAGKLANNDITKSKHSKVIAMQFHWLRDRIAQGQFSTTWKPGNHNIADFFTKVVPVHHFVSMVPVFNAINTQTHTAHASYANPIDYTKPAVRFRSWVTNISPTKTN